MNKKHIDSWIEVCKVIAKNSDCHRAQHGAVIVEPKSNAMIASGYNGGQRGGSSLCGEYECQRNVLKIKSGENIEIGCIHAEMNALINLVRVGGVSSIGCDIYVTGEPCLMCSKLIQQAGIRRAYIIKGGYSSDDGPIFLKKHGVEVIYV